MHIYVCVCVFLLGLFERANKSHSADIKFLSILYACVCVCAVLRLCSSPSPACCICIYLQVLDLHQYIIVCNRRESRVCNTCCCIDVTIADSTHTHTHTHMLRRKSVIGDQHRYYNVDICYTLTRIYHNHNSPQRKTFASMFVYVCVFGYGYARVNDTFQQQQQ